MPLFLRGRHAALIAVLSFSTVNPVAAAAKTTAALTANRSSSSSGLLLPVLRHTCPSHRTWPHLQRHLADMAENGGDSGGQQCPSTLAKKMSEWHFAESTLSSLPLDPETENYVRRNVPKTVFSLCRPTPLKYPRSLIAVNDDVLRDVLDMDPSIVEDEDFVDFVSGNKVLENSVPMSHRYGGHQFGYWADQLGDGRAHLLGEIVNSRGERWELQLKGAGRTPYSRTADGRAVLRSSVREFLCSEAMFYLGVRTSRAASLIVTDDPIPRDQFYDGNLKYEKAAVVLRLAPTWFRFGSFEILSRHGEIPELRRLTAFAIRQSFPDIWEANPPAPDSADGGPSPGAVLAMLARVTEETAQLMAEWMSVGFTHGVMNTDNLSLVSVTIDYGPFGFVEEYDPHFIPNTSDDLGRYDLQNQPSIGLWNLQKLSVALAPLIPPSQQGQMATILSGYEKLYQTHFLKLFRRKLGLINRDNGEEHFKEDMKLLALLMDALEMKGADFTMTFRELSEFPLGDVKEMKVPEESWALKRLQTDQSYKKFVELYSGRFSGEDGDKNRRELMIKSNPRYVLRNWMAQRATEMADNGDFEGVRKILRVLKRPFERQEEAEEAGYASKPPSWSRTIKVSCSS